MTSYLVKQSAIKREPFDFKGSQKIVYRLDLEADGELKRNVEWFTNATTIQPQEGATLDGEIESTDYGLKFKLERKAGFGGGSFGPRPEDPKRSAAILRQHSQHMALLYMNAIEPEKRPQSWADFWALVDKFDVDVLRTRDAA